MTLRHITLNFMFSLGITSERKQNVIFTMIISKLEDMIQNLLRLWKIVLQYYCTSLDSFHRN